MYVCYGNNKGQRFLFLPRLLKAAALCSKFFSLTRHCFLIRTGEMSQMRRLRFKWYVDREGDGNPRRFAFDFDSAEEGENFLRFAELVKKLTQQWNLGYALDLTDRTSPISVGYQGIKWDESIRGHRGGARILPPLGWPPPPKIFSGQLT